MKIIPIESLRSESMSIEVLKVKHANMNLKPHNEGYYMIMSLHLHYLVDRIVQLPS
jgi:hypothetical protein